MEKKKSSIREKLNLSRGAESSTNNKKKLDRVGPVDNRPFTDKLQNFVRKKKKIIMTCDM